MFRLEGGRNGDPAIEGGWLGRLAEKIACPSDRCGSRTNTDTKERMDNDLLNSSFVTLCRKVVFDLGYRYVNDGARKVGEGSWIDIFPPVNRKSGPLFSCLKADSHIRRTYRHEHYKGASISPVRI